MSASSTRHSASEVVRFQVRLPREVRDEVREIAKRELRPMNQEIVLALKNHIAAHDDLGKAA